MEFVLIVFVICAASVWQLFKAPVHACVSQSNVCGKVSIEKLYPQVSLSSRSNTLSTSLVGKQFNTRFDSSSFLSSRSRKAMAARGMLRFEVELKLKGRK